MEFVNIKEGVFTDDFDTERMPIQFPYELDHFQKYSVIAIEQGHNVLVTAHTSAGKSTVAEYAIARAFADNKRAIYTSPIKTLSNQKYKDFKERFGEVGILTGDIKLNPDKQLLIMTTEILLQMLYRGENILNEVGVIIFDEIHYFNDKDRGHVWEESLVLIPREITIVGLSATIDKPEKFAAWLGKLKQKPIHLIKTSFRPVPLNHFIYADDEIMQIMDNKQNFMGGNYQLAVQQLENEKKRNTGSNGHNLHWSARFNDFVRFLKQKDLFPAIIFSFSRKKCEEYGQKISVPLIGHETQAEITKIVGKILSGDRAHYKEMTQVQILEKLLMKGIGVHHSGLLPIMKEIIEILFSQGLLKLLFATETFAVGVNMPTRTVIFTELEKHDGSSEMPRFLHTHEYLQMAGRAGRRGKDTVGTVIYFALHGPLELNSVRSIMTGKTNQIHSQFQLDSKFILSVLTSKETDIMETALTTYANLELKDQMEFIKLEMGKQTDFCKMMEEEMNPFKLEDYYKYLEDMEKVGMMRGKSQKSFLNKLKNNETYKVIETKMDKFKQWKQIYDQFERNKESLEATEKWMRDKCSLYLNFLADLAYVRLPNDYVDDLEDDLDHIGKPIYELALTKENLSVRGLVASIMKESHEIYTTELIMQGVLESSMSDEQIVGILATTNDDSSVPNDTSSIDALLDKEPGLKTKYDECVRIWEDVMIKYNDWGIADEQFEPTFGFCLYAYLWVKGDETIESVRAKSGMYEGNIIRSLMKLNNVCQEMARMYEVLHQHDMAIRLQEMEKKILRNEVNFDSLYLSG